MLGTLRPTYKASRILSPQSSPRVVEHPTGFVGHDVDWGLFHDWCPFMDSRLRGNDGGDPHRQESMTARLIFLRHSRVDGNPLSVTVIHADHSA